MDDPLKHHLGVGVNLQDLLRLESLLQLWVSSQDTIFLNQPSNLADTTTLNVPEEEGQVAFRRNRLENLILEVFWNFIFVHTLRPRAFPAWLWC